MDKEKIERGKNNIRPIESEIIIKIKKIQGNGLGK